MNGQLNIPAKAAPRVGRRPRPATLPKAVAQLDSAPDARRIAAVILEVLAGVRSTAEAALALAVSLPRYYALEARAIEGLVRACEPMKRGKVRSATKEIEMLRAEKAKLERDCARQQALARAAQRTLGLTPAAPAKKTSDPPGTQGAKRRRSRRPKSRALVAAAALGRSAEPEKPAASPNASSRAVS